MDGDGYISYQDFADKIKAMEIPATNKEIMTIAKTIDSDKNGFIDFSNFMHHFQPNLPEITGESLPYIKDKILIGSVNGSAVPSTEFYRNQIGRCKSTNSKLKSVTNSFKVSSDIHMNLKPSTRFSATPHWKDTFINYHMDNGSSGYISEQDRFKKTGNSLHIKNQFQADDKMRKTQMAEGRLNRKREVYGRVEEKAYSQNLISSMN